MLIVSWECSAPAAAVSARASGCGLPGTGALARSIQSLFSKVADALHCMNSAVVAACHHCMHIMQDDSSTPVCTGGTEVQRHKAVVESRSLSQRRLQNSSMLSLHSPLAWLKAVLPPSRGSGISPTACPVILHFQVAHMLLGLCVHRCSLLRAGMSTSCSASSRSRGGLTTPSSSTARGGSPPRFACSSSASTCAWPCSCWCWRASCTRCRNPASGRLAVYTCLHDRFI